MRLVARVIIGLCCLAAFALAVYGGLMMVRWSQGAHLDEREPARPMALESLGRYTRSVAGRPWFGAYFQTMVFDQRQNPTQSATVIRWDRPRVSIKLLNSGGPQVEAYVRALVVRLDRLQRHVRFVVAGAGPPQITIRFLTHDAYVRTQGAGSVGNTRTRFYTRSPGLIRARITIDAGAQSEPDELKATLIHEITHAIGCGGHFQAPSDRRRSVMYAANTLTSWSQNDAAVIRLLYSPAIRVGMSPSRARASLQLFAAGR